MKIIVPVIRKTEIGYRLTTTFVYGQDPVRVDSFIHRYEPGLHTAFDTDLQIASRALHTGHIAWKATAMVVVLPPVFAVIFLAHVIGEAWNAGCAAVREIVSDIPDIHDALTASLARHFKEVTKSQ